LGALAYPLLSYEGKPEIVYRGGNLYSSAIEILNLARWVAYRVVDPDPRFLVETRDIGRVRIVPYVRSEHVYPGSAYLWAVQSHGKVYAPGAMFDVIYIVRGSESDIEKLTKAAWGIVRLGVKESIASVYDVSLHSVRVVHTGTVNTSYSFPLSLAQPEQQRDGDYVVVRLPTVSRESYRVGVVANPFTYFEDYVIPIDSIRVRIVSPEKAQFLEVEGVGTIVTPKLGEKL
ncbi:MAG TPA: type I-A CRISPR-associated protein Cas5, partial [Aigarchaeota archaeon]|nr:type I-A CRISPR-associated protein Cas5 [Aigarchaeota archaeon]